MAVQIWFEVPEIEMLSFDLPLKSRGTPLRWSSHRAVEARPKARYTEPRSKEAMVEVEAGTSGWWVWESVGEWRMLLLLPHQATVQEMWSTLFSSAVASKIQSERLFVKTTPSFPNLLLQVSIGDAKCTSSISIVGKMKHPRKEGIQSSSTTEMLTNVFLFFNLL